MRDLINSLSCTVNNNSSGLNDARRAVLYQFPFESLRLLAGCTHFNHLLLLALRGIVSLSPIYTCNVIGFDALFSTWCGNL